MSILYLRNRGAKKEYKMNVLKINRNKITHTTVLIGMLIAVLLILLVLIGHDFYRINNLRSMGFQIPEFGFLAIAMSLAMISGGIDLSIIATMNLAGILGAMLLTNEGAIAALGAGPVIILAILIILFASGICGLVNGLLISKLGVPPILATLGTMMFYSGVGMGLTGGEGVVGFPSEFSKIGNATIAGVPAPLILILLSFLILGYILKNTIWGRSLYFVGESKVAARFSGLNNAMVIIKTYIISGLLSGGAAIILMSRVNSAKVGYGDTYQLQAILVAVLGGIDPDGGSGDLKGVLLGIIILQSLQSAFTIFTFSPYAKKLIWGLMLLLVMIINFIRLKRK